MMANCLSNMALSSVYSPIRIVSLLLFYLLALISFRIQQFKKISHHDHNQAQATLAVHPLELCVVAHAPYSHVLSIWLPLKIHSVN